MPTKTTLDELERALTECARRNGATDVRIASQFDFINRFGPGVEKGVCHGLSMMYLAYIRSGIEGSFFEDVNATKLSKGGDAPYVPYILKAHEMQKRGNEDEAVGEGRQHTMMTGFGMTFREKVLFGGGFGHGHRSLGKYVGTKPYFHLLRIPGHKMAAHSSRSAHRFYDPNMGEVTFASTSKLGAFLSDYFKSPLMMRNYGKGGSKIQVTAFRYSA